MCRPGSDRLPPLLCNIIPPPYREHPIHTVVLELSFPPQHNSAIALSPLKISKKKFTKR